MRRSLCLLLFAGVAVCPLMQAQAGEGALAAKAQDATPGFSAPIPLRKPPFPVDAHLDAYAKFGNDRRLGGTEAFLPLSWDGQVLSFADLRFVADDADGREVNAGLGLRRVSDDGSHILGGYGFLDRRRSSTGNLYTQATVGAEFLTVNWDIRANGYLPLSEGRAVAETRTGMSPSLKLTGTGILASRDEAVSVVTEHPLAGGDIEIGRKLPFLENTWFDDTRAYAGAFHFDAQHVRAMDGFRFRVETAPFEWLRFGAEHQQDNIRGETGFVEARIRVPLDFWRGTQHGPARPEGILKRLDTRISRDVDVVTQNAAEASRTDTETAWVQNTATGTAQRVYVVDNTAGPGGDGSAENPFNTLAAAQGAAGAHDILYVKHGNGTSGGMNAGIVLDDDGQRLIGSGVVLDFDTQTMRLSGFSGSFSDGTVIEAATADPVITNVNVNGDGVTMAADDVEVAGVTVSGAARHGIYANANGAGQSLDNLRVRDSTISSANTGRGVYLYASGGGAITNPQISGVTARNNAQTGIRFQAEGAGSVLSGAQISGVTAYNNTGDGIRFQAEGAGSVLSGGSVSNSTGYGNATGSGLYFFANNGGQVITPQASGITAYNNTLDGIRFQATGAGSVLSGGRIEDSETYGNTGATSIGLLFYANNGGQVTTPQASGITAYNNTFDGIRFQADGAGSVLSGGSVSNSTGYGNATNGLLFYANNGGQVTTLQASGIITHNNTQYGMYVYATGAGSAVTGMRVEDTEIYGNTLTGLYLRATANGAFSAAVEDVTATGNAQHGVYVDDDTAGAYTVDFGGGALGSSGNNRIYGNTLTDLRVDLDGGQLKAENNWWGNPAGLQPARVTLEVGSTVDSTPFLLTDPDP